MTTKRTVTVARLETRSFTFEAFGHDQQDAYSGLVEGLLKHGKQYGLTERWWDMDAVEVRTFTAGACYRDNEQL